MRRSRKTEIFQRVEVDVALPDLTRALGVALGIRPVDSPTTRAGQGRTSFISSVATSFMCRKPTIARGIRVSPPILIARLATRIALISSRRSTATGWRRAMVITARSSISRCSAVDGDRERVGSVVDEPPLEGLEPGADEEAEVAEPVLPHVDVRRLLYREGEAGRAVVEDRRELPGFGHTRTTCSESDPGSFRACGERAEWAAVLDPHIVRRVVL